MATPTTKKPDTANTPRDYHVQLVDGERTLKAANIVMRDGVLMLNDHQGDVKVMYAPGQWKFVELETQDD